MLQKLSSAAVVIGALMIKHLSKRQTTKILMSLCRVFTPSIHNHRQLTSLHSRASTFKRITKIKPFHTIHITCHLLYLLLTVFGGLYCKHFGPDQTCPKRGSRPIRVHGVCFRDKISLGAFEYMQQM